ncbi:hypothetical protein CEXT_410661 [Caerostris extrusa]|uniref:Uncharacterized protein n=1 Tax=Caerostris extrusa TaxID=172846 RepID=A0AAV4P2A8_CAEEX|nr:hypothetical protein CEXT_410661 [Caerostris extrusa]
MLAKIATLLKTCFAVHGKKMSCAHQYSTEFRLQHKRRVDTDKTVSFQTTHPKAPSTIIPACGTRPVNWNDNPQRTGDCHTVFMHFTPYCLSKMSFLF